MAIAASKQIYFRPASESYRVIAILSILACFGYLFQKIMDVEVGLAPLYLLALVQITPIILCITTKRFNYIAFILFNHFFCYSIPKFNQLALTFRTTTIYPEALVAIQELTICTILIMLGYYSMRFVLPSHRSNEPYQLLTLKRWQLLVVSGYTIFFPFFMSYIPTWYIAIHFTIMGADMMLLLSSDSPGNERLAAVLKVGVILSTILFFIYTGMLALVGVLAAYVFIAACIRRKMSFFIVPVVLTVIGSSIQAVKADYRVLVTGNPQFTAMERWTLLSNLLSEKFSDVGDVTESVDLKDTVDEGGDNAEKLVTGFARLGDDSLERVLDWTPKRVPFWGGETYAHIPYIFIPRALWHDKPSRYIWHKFGVVYGYLAAEDTGTSVGVSYLAEAYMNFGFAGMYTVAFFFGVFAWLVEAMAASLFKGNFAFTFMVFLIPLQWYAADLGTVLNSVVIMLAVLLLFKSQILSMARNDVYTGAGNAPAI